MVGDRRRHGRAGHGCGGDDCGDQREVTHGMARTTGGKHVKPLGNRQPPLRPDENPWLPNVPATWTSEIMSVLIRTSAFLGVPSVGTDCR